MCSDIASLLDESSVISYTPLSKPPCTSWSILCSHNNRIFKKHKTESYHSSKYHENCDYYFIAYLFWNICLLFFGNCILGLLEGDWLLYNLLKMLAKLTSCMYSSSILSASGQGTRQLSAFCYHHIFGNACVLNTCNSFDLCSGF